MNLLKSIFVYCLILLLCNGYVRAQESDLKFEHIGWEKGLTASSVLCILQDNQGFLWFGTTDGLFRYDGYGMTVYKHDRLDSTSLGNNYIWDLFVDADGTIWVGTSSGGLNRFDRKKEQFVRYLHDPENPNSISSDVVISLYQDRGGTLWAGTFQGLNGLNLKEGKITRLIHDSQNPSSAPSKWVRSMCEDKSGAMWLGTEGGLSRLDVQTGKFEYFVADSKNPRSLSSDYILAVITDDSMGTVWIGSSGGLDRFDLANQRITHFDTGAGVTSLLLDHSGSLWIGTGKGLLQLNLKTYRITKFFHDARNSNSLSSNAIESIYQDRTGVLWFGTRKGVNRLDLKQQRFKHIRHDPDNPNSLSNNAIGVIHAGASGAIWVADYGDQGIAIDKIDPETKKIYHSLPGLKKEDLSHGINHIIEDSSGILWFATSKGLGRYDPKGGEFTRFTHEENNPNSLITNNLECNYEDRTGRLWVAIYHYGPTGISKFDRKKGRFIHINLVPESRSSFSSKNGIISISEGRSGRLWFATKGDGIFLLNPGSDKFIQISHDPNNPNSLSHNWVKIVHEDREGILWAAPWSSGLNKYDPQTGQFTFYTEADGLPGSDIINMVEDDRGYLWLTTNSALSRFDPRTGTFKNFDQDDGLINDGFQTWTWHASAKSRTGEIFFGDINGIDYVHPDSIRDNPYIPPIVFTRFTRYNTSDPSGKVIIEKGISEKQRIDLTYQDHTLTFEFAALNYRAPHKNQYAYKLEGFDDNWIDLGSKHDLTFTNLDPGEYILHVKGSNNDGIWNEEGASLVINISPPWWQTSWAYTIYVILIGLTLYGLRRFELRRKELKNELERKDFEAQKLQEVDRLKSRFFANISHEFRTPLTLILGPLQKFLSTSKDKESHKDVLTMQRNARRLQQLIDQLLDLSKIEAGRMPLQAQPDDIVQRIREWTASFVSLAESRNITLDLNFPEKSIIVYFDPEKLEKIIYNLLGNAFKFTPEGGSVIVDCRLWIADLNPKSQMSDFVQITIKDTGVGIGPEHVHHIFDRFYSTNESTMGEQSSTGIGLALTKEFVELHHGKIEVSSEAGKGTKFTVMLPVGKDHLQENEIADSGMRISDLKDKIISHESSEQIIELVSQPAAPIERSAIQNPLRGRRPKSEIVLIVEDNPDMRRFLRKCLTQYFDIIEAENGKSGYEIAQEKMPALIVSDVMMPEMDGFEFCQKIKTDERTSHIPVILLTARASKESKVEGLETGADDYVVKPFDAEELVARSKNLIRQRQKLRERFSREITVKPKDITVTSIDEAFLQRAINIVEENMSNSDFNIDQFSNEISMSRPTLNRKLRALTGLSTNEFVRTIRLKRASQLLENRSATIVEIAYEVGFNNPSYFAECFREQFGKSPSEFGKDE